MEISHPLIAMILCRVHGLLLVGISVVLCGYYLVMVDWQVARRRILLQKAAGQQSLHKTASTPSEIISNRVCEIWLGIGEGANVLISM